MIKSIAKISSTVALLAFAGAAHAQAYGELGYSKLDFEVDGVGTADVATANATLGYQFSKNFAIEGFYAGGVKDDDLSVLGFPVNVDPNNAYGVFLKPKLTLGEKFELYAKAGWAKSDVDFNVPGGTFGETDDDFAWGAGAQFNFTPKAYLTAGYLNLYDKEDIKVDGWNVSLGYKF